VRGALVLSRLSYDPEGLGPDDRASRALGRGRGMESLPEGRVTYKAGKENKRYGGKLSGVDAVSVLAGSHTAHSRASPEDGELLRVVFEPESR